MPTLSRFNTNLPKISKIRENKVFITMITWMQRHKKYLIITIWISTIAFIGAGFVGWGQYSYGDKAGAIAKVGTIEITQGELQKTYSNLYSRYNQIFQGNFDEEKAKQFGLKKQAFEQLQQQALILNLAAAYDIQVSDDEILAELETEKYFFKDGVFSKELYKNALRANNLSSKEYEDEIKKNLMIQKTLQLLPIKTLKSETAVFNALSNIADKINYKVLTKKDVTLDTSDKALKTFWNTISGTFMTQTSYDIQYIVQTPVANTFSNTEIASYYKENKNHFKDAQSKIIPLEKAKEQVIAELIASATKKAALKNYILYKKDKLTDANTTSVTISSAQNPFTPDVLAKVSKLGLSSSYLKPSLVNGKYITIKLLKVNAPTVKTYAQAKAEVLALYLKQKTKSALQAKAKQSLNSFQGTTTDFITYKDSDKLTLLSKTEAAEFLSKLFVSANKNAYIALKDGTIVLYNILEQKMLSQDNTNTSDIMQKIKSNLFNTALIKELQNKYPTEVFVKGL